MTSELDRTPPHDLDAEQALLGALMLGGRMPGTPLKADDFFQRAHATVFSAISELHDEDEPVDVVTVAHRLERAGSLQEVGDRAYLLDLNNAGILKDHSEPYAEIVVDLSRRRRLIRAVTRTVAHAYTSSDSTEEIIGGVMEGMLALQDGGRRESDRASIAVATRLQEYANPTPTVTMPGTNTRLHFGDMCVIGGRPGTGKTAIAVQAADVLRHDHRVLVLSFEMSRGELADRFIARATGKSPESAYSGLSESERAARENACADLLGDRNLELVQAAGMTEAQTVSRIRSFASSGGGIVVLDYLQIAADSRTNENADLTRFMRTLQQVVKQTGVCLIALSQFSREATDGRPALHHLRGSGSIEQEAATVGLMWSPDADQDMRKAELARKGYALDAFDPRRLIRLAWQKVRHGANATDYFLFDGATMRLEPVVRPHA